MELTIFGYACRQHRIRKGVVMARQAAALNLPVSTICKIERGTEPVSKRYMASLIKWMELTEEEASELRLRALLKPKTSLRSTKDSWPTSLANILDNHIAADSLSAPSGFGDAA